jgi:penicillin-binding protein 2
MSVFGQNLKSRFAVLGVVIVLVLGTLLVRLWSMQIILGKSYADMSENNRVREVTIAAPRGRIFDRNGKPLVVNRATLAVAVSPTVARDAEADARPPRAGRGWKPSQSNVERANAARGVLTKLATLLNTPMDEIVRKITNTKLEALQPRVVAVDVPRKAVSYIAEHAEDFPGVEVQTVAVREYPNGALAAHVLGYVGEIADIEMSEAEFKDYKAGDIIGKAGVEREFETVLQGEKGYQSLEVDARGRIHRVLERREPIPGRDIRLTIDIDVQRVAEKALQNAFDEARREGFPNARAGAIVVTDVKTGAVVALASAPSYDPRQFVGGISQKEWRSLNATESQFPLTDRVLMSSYAPASTFKVVTGLAALKEGIASEGSDFYCGGTWKFPGHEDSNAKWWTKKCWKASGHGSIGFVGGIEQSCDSVFYDLGYKFWELGATSVTPGERLQAFARSVGFGSKTGIDLPGEVAGRVPDAAWKKRLNGVIAPEYAPWVPGDTVNMAIGQGDLLVTPIQMSVLFGAVGNGGDVLRPHVLDQVMGSKGKAPVLQSKAVVTHRIPVDASQLGIMQRALLGVTEDGTAKGTFAGFGVEVGGKTGTAQVGNQAKGAKGKKDDYALFGGYAPAEDPRYAVAVVIEQGGHGGSVAAPAAREVLAQLNGLPVTHVSGTDVSR